MKKKKLMFLTPRWYSYGGMFHSLYLGLSLAKYTNRKLIILYPFTHIHKGCKFSAILNKHLREFSCDDVEIVAGYRSWISKILSLWVSLNRLVTRSPLGRVLYKLKLQKLIPIALGVSGLNSPKEIQNHLKLSEPVNWRKVYEDGAKIDLTQSQNKIAQEKFKKLGIPDGKSFVCLYVRDSGFEKNRVKTGSNICNAPLESFFEAVDYLISKGYYIVRVGDPAMIKSRFIHPQFIDYIHSEHYDHLLDLYLYKNCEFWLNTEGGGCYAPAMYGKKCLVADGIELYASGSSFSDNNIFITKHIFSINDNRFLSIKEQFCIMQDLHPNVEGYEGKYIYVPNTSQEIAEMIKEDAIDKAGQAFDWRNDLQKQYHNLREIKTKEVFYDDIKNIGKHIVVDQFYHFRPKVSKFFLENCWEYGNYLEKLTENYLNQNMMAKASL